MLISGILFPRQESRGPIEASNLSGMRRGSSSRNFHGKKVVAPLKQIASSIVPSYETYHFHGKKVVAPLKQFN